METEVANDLFPVVRIYRDGRVERLVGTATVSPSLNAKTGIQSKDVAVSSGSGMLARLHIPKAAIDSLQKLPVLVYFHGGGFVVETARSLTYHILNSTEGQEIIPSLYERDKSHLVYSHNNYLNALAAKAYIIAVSVDYRRAPKHPLPAAYDDSWTTLKWVASHFAGNGPKEWLNSPANLNKVFMAGDSAGGNIVHNMGTQLGEEKPDGIELAGAIMVHPYFWGNEPLPSETTKPKKRYFLEEFWLAAKPTTTGCDDPLINPANDPRLSGFGVNRVLICVAEKDTLRQRDWYYKQLLSESGWRGAVEVMEAPGEDHVFHLLNPSCDNAVKMKKLVTFMNEDK